VAEASVAVLDASVAVKLVVPEAGTAESLAAFEGPRRWIAPRLMAVEVASALRRKCEHGGLTAAEAGKNVRQNL